MALLCAYNDIVSKLLYSYKNGEDIYVICSVEGDAQFFCKKQDVEVIMYALSLFDGEHTLEEIKGQVKNEYPNLKSDKMLTTLSNSRFIKSNSSQNSSNELERNSLNLLKIDLSFMKKIKPKAIDLLFYIFNLLFISSIGVVFLLFILQKVSFSSYFTYAHEKSYLREFIFIILSGIPCMLLHESAHMITVMHYRLFPKTVGISLYYNFFPMYYVITPGTYLLSSRARINYHIAGVMANFILFSFFSLLGYMTNESGFYVIAFSNLQVVVINLMPFSLSDGYFLSCVIFKKVNLRLKFMNVLALQEKISKQSRAVKIYFIFAFGYMIFLSFNLTFWLKNIISDHLGYRIRSIAFDIIAAMLVLMIMFITVFIKSRKNKPSSNNR